MNQCSEEIESCKKRRSPCEKPKGHLKSKNYDINLSSNKENENYKNLEDHCLHNKQNDQSPTQTLTHIYNQLNSEQQQEIFMIAKLMSDPINASRFSDSTNDGKLDHQFGVLSPCSNDESNAEDAYQVKQQEDIFSQFELAVKFYDDEDMECSGKRVEIYKNALTEVCDENEKLRLELAKSIRKSNELKIEQNDFEDTIIELANTLQLLTEGNK